MKWIKRILVTLSVLLICGAAIFLHMRQMLYAHPANRPQRLSQEVKEAAGARAFQKIEGIYQDFNSAQAERHKVYATLQRNATSPASDQPHVFEYSFTQDEINAWLSRLHDAQGDSWDAHVKDLEVKLEDDQLILFGTLVGLNDLEASLYVSPGLDSSGQLQLEIIKLRGGNLPLPQRMLDGELKALRQTLNQNLPGTQLRAHIDNDGMANSEAKDVAMGKLLIGILDGKTVDPIFFVELPNRHFAPIRLVGVSIENEQLKIQVRPLDPGETAALQGQLQQPVQTAKVDSENKG